MFKPFVGADDKAVAGSAKLIEQSCGTDIHIIENTGKAVRSGLWVDEDRNTVVVAGREVNLRAAYRRAAYGKVAGGQIVILIAEVLFIPSLAAVFDLQDIVILRFSGIAAEHMGILIHETDAGKNLIFCQCHTAGAVFDSPYSRRGITGIKTIQPNSPPLYYII